MNNYDIIYEMIQEEYDMGLITFEQADALNDIAYIESCDAITVTEDSKDFFEPLTEMKESQKKFKENIKDIKKAIKKGNKIEAQIKIKAAKAELKIQQSRIDKIFEDKSILENISLSMVTSIINSVIIAAQSLILSLGISAAGDVSPERLKKMDDLDYDPTPSEYARGFIIMGLTGAQVYILLKEVIAQLKVDISVLKDMINLLRGKKDTITSSDFSTIKRRIDNTFKTMNKVLDKLESKL